MQFSNFTSMMVSWNQTCVTLTLSHTHTHAHTNLVEFHSVQGRSVPSPSGLTPERSSRPCDRIQYDRRDGRAGHRGYGCQRCSFSPLPPRSTWNLHGPLELKYSLRPHCLWNQTSSPDLFVFTCVALCGGRNQAVVFACSVNVTPIQGDRVRLVVLRKRKKSPTKSKNTFHEAVQVY